MGNLDNVRTIYLHIFQFSHISIDMELLFLSLSILLIFVSIFLSISTYKNKVVNNTAVLNLPPGSFGLPFIGETLEFLYSDQEKFVRDRMNKYSQKIFKTSILGEPTAVFCGPQGNKFIFSNAGKLTAVWRPLTIYKLFRTYKHHRTESAVVQPNNNENSEESLLLRQPPFLKPEALMGYLGTMDSIAKQHLKMNWEGRDEVKVFTLAKCFTLTLACRLLLGLDDPDRVANMVSAFDKVTKGVHSIAVDFPGTVFSRAKKAAGEIRKELEVVVTEKTAVLEKGGPIFDVLSHMIAVKDPSSGGTMEKEEIADKAMGLVVAGYSTVATAIAFLMKYTGQNPQVYRKIQKEHREIMKEKKAGDEALQWEDIQKMKYSWNVAQEVMRLVPPLQGTFREAVADFTFAGFTVPKGWKIYWSVSSTNKNPEYFAEPERFDPSRYEGNGPAPYTFVPFGGGVRTCPGKEYARTTILTFLHNVVKRFEWETMFPDEKIIGEMTPTPALGLPLRIRPI